MDDSKWNQCWRSPSTHCRRAADSLERLDLSAVVFYRALQRARRIDTGLLGLGGRLLRPQILRRNPRQHESLLHLGRHPRPLRRRRDLRPHTELRVGLYRHHDRTPDFHRDDGALNQAVGETRNVRSDANPLKPFAGMIRLLCQLPISDLIPVAAVASGSNPSSDQPLPPPLAARSREGGRAWNEFLTNHCGNRQH